MTLDTKARATANSLIAKLGKSIGYTSVINGVYDPATGAATPAEIVFAVKALVEPFGSRSEAFSNGLIREGDRKITIAALGLTFTPKPGDKAIFDGGSFTILSVSPTYSGELVALYTVHGRK